MNVSYNSVKTVILEIALKLKVNKGLRCLRKMNMLNFEKKLKSPFMICVDFESILIVFR